MRRRNYYLHYLYSSLNCHCCGQFPHDLLKPLDLKIVHYKLDNAVKGINKKKKRKEKNHALTSALLAFEGDGAG